MTRPEDEGPTESTDGSLGPAGSGRSAATVLGAVAVGVVFVLLAGGIWLMTRPEPEGRVHTFEIPAGTGDRIDAGEEVSIVPAVLEVEVNDTVVIENDDDQLHLVGPLVVPAGETLVHEFDRPGRFQGACELHPEDTFTVVVG